MEWQLTLLMLIFFVKAMITVELIWKTEKLSYQCCQSKNQLLMWNFTEGENERVMELRWFFNETTLICIDSKTIGFHVETIYNGRIERNGTAGILLKDISLYDAGKYTLYVKLEEEKTQNVQNIFLTVYEEEPSQCKPRIEIQHQNVMYCSTTCFERSELSPEWIINGTRDSEGIGRYLKIYAGINKQASCCLRGLKCHDMDLFCVPNPISSKIFTQGGHNETSTIKARNEEGSHTSNVLTKIGLMIATSLFFLTITVAYFWRKRYKSHRSLPHSNSNQNIQSVNNSSMDGVLLKYMVETRRLLMINQEAAREEIRELQQLLSSYQHMKKLDTRQSDKFIEMMEIK